MTSTCSWGSTGNDYIDTWYVHGCVGSVWRILLQWNDKNVMTKTKRNSSFTLEWIVKQEGNSWAIKKLSHTWMDNQAIGKLLSNKEIVKQQGKQTDKHYKSIKHTATTKWYVPVTFLFARPASPCVSVPLSTTPASSPVPVCSPAWLRPHRRCCLHPLPEPQVTVSNTDSNINNGPGHTGIAVCIPSLSHK